MNIEYIYDHECGDIPLLKKIEEEIEGGNEMKEPSFNLEESFVSMMHEILGYTDITNNQIIDMLSEEGTRP